MLFASNIFMFFFLPIVLFIYYVFMRTRKMKNIFLLIASLIFYSYGEPSFVLIMLFSIIINYIVGILISKFEEHKKRFLKKTMLMIGLIFNLSILFKYKYLVFLLKSFNSIFKSNLSVPDILLPIGISFFTFQILSYIIDLYRGKVLVQKNIFNLGLYISLFPQLIAGPIVRYETVQDQIMNRKENLDDFSLGIERFIKGLGKKVIISNTMALIADYVFNGSIDVSITSTSLVWISAISYMFQIYFDFSGYSDMAIGLGKMFGFTFEENFNYPYMSESISDFWRRWHISLGTWFKDYVYIPLGGSRCSRRRLVFNLFVVWFLTGLWHGANWTFIVWGLFYFILLVFEKSVDFDKKFNNYKFLKRIYTLFLVLIGWIIFRSPNLNFAFSYLLRMFNFKNLVDLKSAEFIVENFVVFVLAILISTPLSQKITSKINIFNSNILKIIFLFLIMIFSVSYMVKGVYNPFIYFNF